MAPLKLKLLERENLVEGVTSYLSSEVGIMFAGPGSMTAKIVLEVHSKELTPEQGKIVGYNVRVADGEEIRNKCYELSQENLIYLCNRAETKPNILRRLSGEIELRKGHTQTDHTLIDVIIAAIKEAAKLQPKPLPGFKISKNTSNIRCWAKTTS